MSISMDSLFWPEVLQVVPTRDQTLYVYFNDGSVRLFDVKPLIKPGTVFAPLADPDYFCSRATVINHTAAWDTTGDRDPRRCIDLDPFVLYEQEIVADPLLEEGA